MNNYDWFFRRALYVAALLLFKVHSLCLMAQSSPPHRSCPITGPNLILNPEFDQDNLGVASSYLYNPDYVCDWGQYSINSTIVYDPAGACYGNPAFDIRTIWAATDRALDGGNYMIVDPCDPTTGGAACQALDANNVIWSQTVSVCPATTYLFSVFAKNLYYLEGIQYPGAGIQPQFDLFVNGEKVRDYHVDRLAIEDTTFAMPQTSIADSAIWREVSGVWTADFSDSLAVLEIRNTQTSSGGNDLAIDGLYFGLCGRDVSILADAIVPQCFLNNNIAPLTLAPSQETQDSDWGYYEWYKNDSVVESDVLLLPTDPIPNLITPADPLTGDYFGEYRLVVYPGINPATSCGNSSETVQVVDSCAPTSFPVEWLSFEATPVGPRIRLRWRTASESQNRGFAVEMRSPEAAYQPIGWVAGTGDSRTVQAYTFDTEALAPGQYVFRLRQIDFDGASHYSPQVQAHLGTQPEAIRLSPNPTKGLTQLSVSPQVDQPVRVELYNLTGQLLRVYYQGQVRAAAPLQLTLDLQGQSQGVYLLRVQGSHFQAQRRLIRR